MKQNNLGWFIVVIALIAWSFYEIYPPTSKSLLAEFSAKGVNQDAAFKQIVTDATVLAATGTNSEFSALQMAVSTNDLQKYFPSYNATNQVRPNLYIMNRLQRAASGKIKLGLDLQGGTEYRLSMSTNVLNHGTNEASQTEVAGALSQAVEVLRKRIDKFGVAEPVIQQAGDNEIIVQMPGLSPSDKEQAIRAITNSAFLEFRMVNDRSADIVNEKTGEMLGAVPPGYEVLTHFSPLTGGGQQRESYVVKKRPASGEAPDYLAGDIITHAQFAYDNLGQPQINFELNSDAGKKFGDITTQYINHRMAIVLDGDLYSAPNIQSPILTGSGQITGHYSQDEARALVNVLQNPLRAPLQIMSTRDVEPTLGKDNIQSGIHASEYAVIGVSVFMLCYYLLAGLAANVALITNVIILLGVMCAAGTTFTLPGIAGGVLTIGMAVDANVLIYERIREELAKGKTLRGAIDAGYARAFGTIFDSHVTTLISSIILIWMGTGEIKGFGVTLTIGVAASLFTALVVTRLIFNFFVDRNILKRLDMFHIIKSTNVNFMAFAKPLAIATTIFIVAALGFGATQGKKLFGVDFLGGDSVTFSYNITPRPSQESVSSALKDEGLTDVQVQYQKDVSSSKDYLNITSPAGTADKVKATLADKFSSAQFHADNTLSVGASVGDEIKKSAVIASLLALLGILFYVAFRYEFSFAIAAVIAVLHDVAFTLGAFCIANAVSGRRFDATIVAAVLTIIGFSINDKIVIFDRIREDLKLGVRGTFKEVINIALNQTLSRTIITSGTVFIATLVLFLFGGGAINGFAFTFLIGILVGTYSSIFVATAVVLWRSKGEKPNIGGSGVTVQNSQAAKV
ncbi:MAG TPA: protein translocase subunit SecD [Candidatus Sulfotelmatobacter sp.]|jgi:SecD/SecF fusion protein|nr:protein translocase subunit SecD [Candidatus Sulfotelmatobacter sp.]